jgi:hypothetical protein
VHTAHTGRDLSRAGCKQHQVRFINKFLNNGLSAATPYRSRVTLSDFACHLDVMVGTPASDSSLLQESETVMTFASILSPPGQGDRWAILKRQRALAVGIRAVEA